MMTVEEACLEYASLYEKPSDYNELLITFGLSELKKSYVNKNATTVQKFTNALQKGMDYVAGHTPEEIAKVIKPQFKETDEATLETIISRYYSQDTWKTDLILQQDSFTLLEDILIDAGQLSDYVNYEDLVTTKFAEEAKK